MLSKVKKQLFSPILALFGPIILKIDPKSKICFLQILDNVAILIWANFDHFWDISWKIVPFFAIFALKLDDAKLAMFQTPGY